jgi:hypothetical protein
VVALLAGEHPAWSPAQLADAARAHADDKPCRPSEYDYVTACVGSDDVNSYAGDGMADALEAVAATP